MIKKIIELYWFRKFNKNRIKKRNYFTLLLKYGFSRMIKIINKDYKIIENDLILKSKLDKKFFVLKTRLFFISIFIILLSYVMFIKSELYESNTLVMVENLSSESSTSNLGLALLGAGSSSQLKDSMIIKEYISSLDMFKILDKKFALIQHYKSKDLDFISRLKKDATLEEALDFYRTRMIIKYDETSGILHISFLHTNPKKSEEILQFSLKIVEIFINKINKKKARKKLEFVEVEYKKSKLLMNKAAKELEEYQNKHLMIDPESSASSYISLISTLKANLAKKEIEYKTKSNYLNQDNYELASLKSEIDQIKLSIKNAKQGLTGEGKEKLNKILFQFNNLKMKFKFYTELYKNALIELKSTKLEVLKNSKTLTIVTKPNLPNGYTYPNKPKMFVTILVGIFLLYGIFSLLVEIIRDHKE